MINKISIKFSNQEDIKYSHEISKTSCANSHLWARGVSSIKNSLIKGRVLMAFQDNKLIAWLIIQHLGNKWVRFNTIYTKNDFRNQGIAKKLIKKAVKANSSNIIYVSISNRRFSNTFRKLGFEDKKLIALPITVLIAIAIEGIRLKTFLKNLKIYTKYRIYCLVLFPKKLIM